MNIEDYPIVTIDKYKFKDNLKKIDRSNIKIENYQTDFNDKLKITRIRDNSSRLDALSQLITQGANDFDGISTLTDITTNYKIMNEKIIAIVPLPTDADCDLLRFTKIQLMSDNVVIDNSYIKKIQLVVSGKVIIDDIERTNQYFPTVGIYYQPREFRVIIDKKSIIQSLPEVGTITLTYEKVIINIRLRLSLFRQCIKVYKDLNIADSNAPPENYFNRASCYSRCNYFYYFVHDILFLERWVSMEEYMSNIVNKETGGVISSPPRRQWRPIY